jgi:hypothetical protein
MRGGMRPILALIAAGGMSTALAACVAQNGDAAPVTASAVDYEARAVAWADVIARASQAPGYGGFERTADRLYVGFTDNAPGKLAHITDRTDVAPFTAPHSYSYMQAQLAAANRAFATSGIPYAALAADYRRGAMVVTDVENAAKRGPFRCKELVPLPRTLAGVSVPIIDERICSE